MKKLEIGNKLSRTFHGLGFQLKKHSPEILIVAGVVGTVASAVLACKATTKVSDILEKTKEDIDIIHDCAEKGYVNNEEHKYTKEDSKKDLTIIYAHTAIDFVKLYGPSVFLGALSITSILASNNILRKRNIALAAAYATVDKGFKEYRGRVIERFGEDLDKELRYNIRKKEVEETVINEDGTQSVVKKTVDVVDPRDLGDYVKFFDETCTAFVDNDREANFVFLKKQQSHANDILDRRGYIFLNEVYEMLGFDKTKSGHVVGWMKNGEGDDFVDFGLFDVYNENARDFTNGKEPCFIVNFNPDGVIYDLVF